MIFENWIETIMKNWTHDYVKSDRNIGRKPEDKSLARKNETKILYESSILAQDERWRRA